MKRAIAIVGVAAATMAAGCGGGGGGGGRSNDAPVRALMQRYVRAMVTHDWEQACAQLTPEAAQRHVLRTQSVDCPHALAFEAGASLAGAPHVHPERAGEEPTKVRIQKVAMLGDKAQVYLQEPPQEPFILLAVRRSQTWLLTQDLGIGIPIDSWSGTLY